MSLETAVNSHVQYMRNFLVDLIEVQKKRGCSKNEQAFIQIAEKILAEGENISPDFLDGVKGFTLGDIKLEDIHLLHVACMVTNNVALEILLKNKVNPDTYYNYNFLNSSPLHFCAMAGNKKGIEILLKFGANPDITNAYRGTYKNIELQLTPPIKETGELIPLVDENDNQLTDSAYYKLTNSHYLKSGDNFVVFKTLFDFFVKYPGFRFTASDHLWEIGKETFLKHKFHCIKKIKLDSDCDFLTEEIKKDVEGQLGVFATQDYNTGDVIGEYLGHLGMRNPGSKYIMEADALEYSNELSRINCGLPNITSVLVKNSRGLPFRWMLICIEPVKKGGQFFLDYGPLYPMYRRYIEFRNKEVRAFIHQIIPELETICAHCNEYKNISIIEKGTKIEYIFDTPLLLIELILDGSLSRDHIQEMYKIYVDRRLNMRGFFKKRSFVKKVVADAIKLREHARMIEQSYDKEHYDAFLRKVRLLLFKFGIKPSGEIQNAVFENLTKKGQS